MKRKADPRGGYALVVVLIIASLFVALAGAVGTQVTTNLGATKKRLNSSSARFAAYAGLQHAVLMLKIDPDWTANLVGVLLIDSTTDSYTLEVTNNRTGTSSVTAPDGTDVPPGAVYCATLGIVNQSESVSLHAMTGMLAERSPELDHGAFADTDLSFVDDAQTLSYDPSTTFFSYDAAGRAIPSSTDTNADVGSNRYVAIADNAGIGGDVYSPVDNPPQITTSNPPTGSLLDLLDPVTVPEYNAPGSAISPQVLSPNPTSLASATPSQPVAFEPLVVGTGTTVTVSPGRYYFPDGIQVQGEVRPAASVDPNNPIIFFVGNDADLGNGARVNVGGETRNFQIYFVDHSDGTSQEFRMAGDSQVFATVVGKTAEGKFSDTAQLFGGFLGRGVDVEGSAQLVYDESLKDVPLGVASNWGLAGITEPPPTEILKAYPASKAFVAAVEKGTQSYDDDVATKAAVHSPSLSL